ncbi:hypothetical protein PH505_ba00670 [Pseudoalteromonas distincta]|jgi:hypothetical protein|uniref:hypothetical protein n=1 Tax=Pseudoalteromonas TaxID=53246 RepID=UPI00020A0BA5|nr:MULTISPECIES: hypothetical protein [Pseudoalteromonas]EGI72998.1 hypothetical protein PH505_ba00670 [Pseudoalteromonas distincta]
MPGPFLNHQPHNHPSIKRDKLRSNLESDFNKYQTDIFVLTHEEFFKLWVAFQTARGKSQTAIEQYLSEITGLSIAQISLASAATYGSAIKDTPSFLAIYNDFKRSGNILGKYEPITRNGKKYIAFKGNHKVRTILKGTRYLANNTQVVNVGVGKEALKQGAKSGFYISVFFSVTLNSINWLFEEDYRWTNWLATTSTDIVKAVLGALAGVLAGIALASGTVAVVAIGSGIIIGVIVSIGLNSIDKRFEITKSLIKYLEYKERYLMKTTGEEIHRVYIATVSSFLKSIKIKARKDLNSFLSELVNPW